MEQDLILHPDKQMKEIKEEHLKKCVPFINCKSEINNIEIDNPKDIDIVTT